MRITSVTYRRLQTFGNYQNEAIEATAEVAPNEEPAAVLAALRGWVDGRMKESAEARQDSSTAQSSVWALRQEEASLQESIRRSRDQYDSIVDWLNKLQIPVPSDWRDTLPF